MITVHETEDVSTNKDDDWTLLDKATTPEKEEQPSAPSQNLRNLHKEPLELCTQAWMNRNPKRPRKKLRNLKRKRNRIIPTSNPRLELPLKPWKTWDSPMKMDG